MDGLGQQSKLSIQIIKNAQANRVTLIRGARRAPRCQLIVCTATKQDIMIPDFTVRQSPRKQKTVLSNSTIKRQHFKQQQKGIAVNSSSVNRPVCICMSALCMKCDFCMLCVALHLLRLFVWLLLFSIHCL